MRIIGQILTRLAPIGAAFFLARCGDDSSPEETPERPNQTGTGHEACFPPDYKIDLEICAKELSYDSPPFVRSRPTPTERVAEACVTYQLDLVESVSNFSDSDLTSRDSLRAKWNSVPAFFFNHEELCRKAGLVGGEELEECQMGVALTRARLSGENLTQQCWIDSERPEFGGCWGPILGALELLSPDRAERMNTSPNVGFTWRFSDNPFEPQGEEPLTSDVTFSIGTGGGFYAGLFNSENLGLPASGPRRTFPGTEEEIVIPYYDDEHPILSLDGPKTGTIETVPCNEPYYDDIALCNGTGCNLLPGMDVGEIGLRVAFTPKDKPVAALMVLRSPPIDAEQETVRLEAPVSIDHEQGTYGPAPRIVEK